jgi:hypothetical protein
MHSLRSNHYEWRHYLIRVILYKFIAVNMERKINISIYLSIYLLEIFDGVSLEVGLTNGKAKFGNYKHPSSRKTSSLVVWLVGLQQNIGETYV